MTSLPNLTTGITINRVEIWVTNKTGTTSNTRNIIALTDLGENTTISNNLWNLTGSPVPANAANSEYSSMVNNYNAARDIDQTTSTLVAINGFRGGRDYEKLQNARLLNSSEYTVNNALGYISLKTSLQTDQVLAVAYEYTYGGITYQVGEFAADNTDTNKALFVKSLKNTSNNPQQGNSEYSSMINNYNAARDIDKKTQKVLLRNNKIICIPYNGDDSIQGVYFGSVFASVGFFCIFAFVFIVFCICSCCVLSSYSRTA